LNIPWRTESSAAKNLLKSETVRNERGYLVRLRSKGSEDSFSESPEEEEGVHLSAFVVQPIVSDMWGGPGSIM